MRRTLLVLPLFSLPACTQPHPEAPVPAISSRAQETSHPIVLVHGAWGGAHNFRQISTLLQSHGHQVSRPSLTGQGERVHLATPDITLDTHITDVVNHILFEDLHDVVLVGHSYGGMVVTGVADRIPDRIARLVYLDAAVPENNQSITDTLRNPNRPNRPDRTPSPDGFIHPSWVKPNTPPPKDVPQPAKTFSQSIHLTNQDAARKIPTTYLLTADDPAKPEADPFYSSYQRARSRGWQTQILPGDHNIQWSNPTLLTRTLESLLPPPASKPE